MQILCVLGVVTLLGGVAVSAHGGGGGGGGGFGGGSPESSSMDEPIRRGTCVCQAAFRRTPASCSGVTGSQVVGCPNTNSFRQCTGTVCAVQACPTGQVWNYVKNACSACDTGKVVSADLQVCVCKQGTTFDSNTQTCVACPTGATVEAELCYCPSTLARDFTTNTCKACPAEAPLRGNQCQCTNATLVFDQSTWTCKACPGTSGGFGRGFRSYECRCTGPNQIFYKRTASCFTCPTGTTASRDSCICPSNSNLYFNYVSGACACKAGYTKNASGTCAVNTLNP